MAGGRVKYRHFSRSSAHRQAMLRNLVTSLIKHESISTTWHKAKEAQPLAEKLVTLAKRNTEASKRKAYAFLYTPNLLIHKLFGEIRERYQERPGGYTRVLRVEPLKKDTAPSAILELVDGHRDMRFAMTARTLARLEDRNQRPNELTQKNVDKVTRFREAGKEQLQKMVRMFRGELTGPLRDAANEESLDTPVREPRAQSRRARFEDRPHESAVGNAARNQRRGSMSHDLDLDGLGIP